MKSKGVRILRGVLNDTEKVKILTNEASGLGWKIRDFRIMPNIPAALEEVPPAYYTARLETGGALGSTSFQFDDNRVVGIASFSSAGPHTIFDSEQLITTDLIIRAMVSNPTAANEPLAWQVNLEAFDVTEFEEIVATIKETAQGGTND